MKKTIFYFLAIFIIATACEKNEQAKKTDNTDKKSTEAVIDTTVTTPDETPVAEVVDTAETTPDETPVAEVVDTTVTTPDETPVAEVVDTTVTTQNEAQIIYEGEPAVDGCGYFLLINNTKYKPTNLPLKFAIKGLYVNIEYQILSSKWSCNWQIEKYIQINIINISKK